MSKRSRERKNEQQALEEARRITPGKLIRLFVKSIFFAVAVSAVLFLLTLARVPGTNLFWVQLLIMLGIYLLAYPFLMSEFRVKTYRKDD